MKLLHRDIVCQQAVALAGDYLEGTLTRRQRRRFERHLSACDGCDAYLAQLRETIAASGSVEPEALDADTIEGLVDLFHRYRDDED